MNINYTMEASLVSAPADAISPALLLTLGQSPKAQYLFNVPEGFSRFALEHRIRPGLGLRAAFLSDLALATGVSGLLMRLRGEGHAAVEFVGPPGTRSWLSSLRHFVGWKHPAVMVAEVAPANQAEHRPYPCVYEDDVIAVAGLWGDEREDTDFRNGGMENGRNGDEYRKWKPPPWMQTRPASPQKRPMDADDRSSSERADTSTSTSTTTGSSSTHSSTTASSSADNGDSCGTSDDDGVFETQREVRMSDGAAAAAAAAAEKHAHVEELWKLRGHTYRRLEVPGVNLFERCLPNVPALQHGKVHPPLLGFVCFIKQTKQVLLVVSIAEEEYIPALLQHPVLSTLQTLPSENVAGSIFMAPRCLHQDSVFQDCMKGIPGMKLFAQQPGYHDQCRGGLGFMSSTRTTIRLNLISGLVFPLPAVFREEVAEESKVAAMYADEALRDAASGRETKALVDEPDQRGLFADNNLTLKQKALHVVTGLVDVAWSNGMPDVRCVHSGWSDSVDVRALQKEALERSVELRPMLEHMKRCVPACQPTAASDQTYPMGHALVDDACAAGAGANAHAASMQALLPTKRPLGCGDGRSLHREAHTKQPSRVTNRGAAIALKARLQGREPHPANDGDVVVAATPRPQSQPIAVDARLRSTVPVTEWPRGNVTFLGTGCAEPSKYRGASSILVSTSSNRSMLLDCGEGAWGQLVRLHGFTRATAILSSLDAVWISHRHADHMSGILQILLRTVQHKDPSHPPLLLIGPRALGDWLREAAPPLGLRHNERYSFIHFSELQKDARHPARSFLNSTLGFSQIACVPVRHCSDAYGIVLKHVEGWSLVYSGDTEPSEALMRAGSGATLLIHEATFEPALVAEARNKRHSTVSEALHVAQRMGAYCTILTHFSQRYPKFPEGLPVIDPGKVGFGGDDMVRVAPAFDGMCVPLHALGQLPLLTPGMAVVLGGGGNAGGLDGAAGDPGACC